MPYYSEGASEGGERNGIGAWSKGGEFLGEARLAERGGGELGGYSHCSVSRGSEERGLRFTLHGFGAGYRVLVEEWSQGESQAVWLAPLDEEEESYVGLFSEEEVRERFPYLLAALQMPDGVSATGRP